AWECSPMRKRRRPSSLRASASGDIVGYLGERLKGDLQDAFRNTAQLLDVHLAHADGKVEVAAVNRPEYERTQIGGQVREALEVGLCLEPIAHRAMPVHHIADAQGQHLGENLQFGHRERYSAALRVAQPPGVDARLLGDLGDSEVLALARLPDLYAHDAVAQRDDRRYLLADAVFLALVSECLAAPEVAHRHVVGVGQHFKLRERW